MERLRKRDLLLVGFTLFSMFFGAGNLIFPPGIAAQAGTMTWFAVLGLAVSAVGLPVLGVVAVARTGGLSALGDRVHPRFSRVFTVVAYLAIGPCLAIPRTATTSFEMAVPPFVGDNAPVGLYQLCFLLVFFVLALLVALRPEKLTDRLGKIMCPILIALILVTFAACLIHPPAGYGAPAPAYYSPVSAVAQGFLQGYQTMDTIAALAFGVIISLNIRARGVQENHSVVRSTVRAGIIAGILLFLIYAMLAHIGAVSAGAFPDPTDGAQALTNVVAALFGPGGSLLLAAIFLIACFNVCVGLISSCGEFFSETFPALSYRQWAVLFALVSFLIANIGLNQILTLSLPVLNIIYPVAIVLILLSFFHRFLVRRPRVYPVTILFTGVASFLLELERLTFSDMLAFIPLADLGLGWLLPALAGLVLGLLLPPGAPAEQ
ncbi:MAG TPA: branched-chain amino acid transport system II carrier protein [Candidatus Flavonifractor intestinipullorum]|uniref:Branched-chain amino acid transport system carrier protein n=1 Tax=Candidatus Flavonifractor intestinipullorum TaxID=2838587 RepID=A0A9D2S5F6_9FIRM|nr:branched-chain amino acid transport system II carrier protein [Candidatus Flavonifractor intestinipullorum]